MGFQRVQIDGQNLLVKATKNTQTWVDQWKAKQPTSNEDKDDSEILEQVRKALVTSG